MDLPPHEEDTNQNPELDFVPGEISNVELFDLPKWQSFLEMQI